MYNKTWMDSSLPIHLTYRQKWLDPLCKARPGPTPLRGTDVVLRVRGGIFIRILDVRINPEHCGDGKDVDHLYMVTSYKTIDTIYIYIYVYVFKLCIYLYTLICGCESKPRRRRYSKNQLRASNHFWSSWWNSRCMALPGAVVPQVLKQKPIRKAVLYAANIRFLFFIFYSVFLNGFIVDDHGVLILWFLIDCFYGCLILVELINQPHSQNRYGLR